jgi:hypothetical protein
MAKLISNLENIIKPAQKVCNDQCWWLWNCMDY